MSLWDDIKAKPDVVGIILIAGSGNQVQLRSMSAGGNYLI